MPDRKLSDRNLELRLQIILRKYCEGRASKEEMDFLALYYETFSKESDFLETKERNSRSALKADMEVHILNHIFSAEKKAKIINLYPGTWIKIAAVVLVLLSSALIFFVTKHSAPVHLADQGHSDPGPANDALPGGNRATLTLANGRSILLDTVHNGTFASQGNTRILKLNNGQLVYDKAGEAGEASPDVLYNTVSTPRGGQFQLLLSDGSRVWLNAASSIRFPAAFSGGERRVELTGEGYFEVAKDRTKPFRVYVHNEVVEVLGTHFNINAYTEERSVKTTLFEGAVKVSSENSTSFIAPGEQAVVANSNGAIVLNRKADLEQVIAWKNGLFHFSNADLPSVMQELSRWYDVDVEYDGAVPEREFEGEMQRNLNLSQVLRLLGKNEVHFKIEGKKLMVTP
jgi:ferric-dicitrate binding protein FerR (iron transport regulator)